MRQYRLSLLRFLKIMALAIPVMLFIFFLPVSDSDDTRRIQDFYLEEPNTLDVVFLGSSDVYAGFSPALAYDEYGFTSYPYVMSGNYIGMLPYQLEDVLSTQSPKLIVIEITEAMNAKPESYDYRLREYIFGLPSFAQRHRLVQELGDPDDLSSYYLPFALYHGVPLPHTLLDNAQRNRMVRHRGYSLLKGALTYTGDNTEEYSPPINTTGDFSTCEPLSYAVDNFTALLTYLRSHCESDVLFVTFPHRTPDEAIYYRHQQANTLGKLIQSYGYNYINLDCYLDDMDIRPEQDFLDDEHLNLYGQYKNTRYLCDILTREYDIGPAILSRQTQKKWDACAEYQKRYYQMFEDYVQSGQKLWLKENTWLLSHLK